MACSGSRSAAIAVAPARRSAFRIVIRERVSVRFHEVDAYNVVHNANYFLYFDQGRFAVVDAFLRRERPPEVGAHLFLVLKTGCKYVKPAQLGDELIVETRMDHDARCETARIELTHRILRARDKELLTEGFSTLGVCDRKYRLLYALPAEIGDFMQERVTHHRQNPTAEIRIT